MNNRISQGMPRTAPPASWPGRLTLGAREGMLGSHLRARSVAAVHPVTSRRLEAQSAKLEARNENAERDTSFGDCGS